MRRPGLSTSPCRLSKDLIVCLPYLGVPPGGPPAALPYTLPSVSFLCFLRVYGANVCDLFSYMNAVAIAAAVYGEAAAAAGHSVVAEVRGGASET